MDAWAVDRFKR